MASEQRFENWQRLLAELDQHWRAELADLQVADDVLLARYVGNVCTPDERQQVDAAIPANPKVRQIISTLRAVRAVDDTVELASVEGPSAWKKQGTICVLDETLKFRRDSLGVVYVEGMPGFRLKKQLARTMAIDDVRRGMLCFEWSLPLETRPVTLLFSVSTDAEGKEWEISGELETDDTNQQMLEQTEIHIHHANGTSTFSAPFQHWQAKPFVLQSGEWVATLSINEWMWRIPLSLGAKE